MTDLEFGTWMMENLELLMPLESELREAGNHDSHLLRSASSDRSGSLLPESIPPHRLHNTNLCRSQFVKSIDEFIYLSLQRICVAAGIASLLLQNTISQFDKWLLISWRNRLQRNL